MRKRKMLLFLALLCVLLSGSALFAQQQIKLDRYFPDSTQIYFSIADVKDLADHWKVTQLNEVLSDPKFKQFRDSLQGQIENNWPNRLGLDFADFSKLPTGEVGGGLIAAPGRKPGFAVMMNVEGNAAQVNDFLVRLIRQATGKQNGVATKERIAVGQQPVGAPVLSFPADKEHPITRTAYYVALPQILIATDQKYLAEMLLHKLAGDKQQASLSSRPEYQAVFQRCAQDAKTQAAPQIRFFANPLAAGEAIRAIADPEAAKTRSPFDVLAKQGFDGIKSVGGTIDFASENCEMVYRVKLYIPDEKSRALKMLSFTNVDSLAPPAWVGENATRYTVFNLNVLAAFDSIGPLFDEFLETEGAWKDVLDSFETDKLGPQVNLRTDLVANFGRQLSSTNAFDPDNPSDGEKFIFSLNILEGKEQAVTDALRKMFEADPDFKRVELAGSEFWQYAPQQGGAVRPGSATRPGATRPGATRPGASRVTAAANAAAARSHRPPAVVQPSGPEAELIKGGVFGVANGYLFVANDAQYLQKKIVQGQTSSILNAPLHQRALEFLAQEPAAKNGLFVQGYGRNVDGFRENYELFRQGKTPEGKTLSAKIVNTILTPPGTKGVRQAKFDGSTLPPFDESFVDKIGFNFFYGVDEKDGYFFKGVCVRP